MSLELPDIDIFTSGFADTNPHYPERLRLSAFSIRLSTNRAVIPSNFVLSWSSAKMATTFQQPDAPRNGSPQEADRLLIDTGE